MNIATLETVKAALLSVSNAVSHYTAYKAQPPYIVWAEDSQSSQAWGDGITLDPVLEGTIDVFEPPNGTLWRNVASALNNYGVPHRLRSVQYEDERNIVHREYIFQAMDSSIDS